jgi:hypothetical protein
VAGLGHEREWVRFWELVEKGERPELIRELDALDRLRLERLVGASVGVDSIASTTSMPS